MDCATIRCQFGAFSHANFPSKWMEIYGHRIGKLWTPLHRKSRQIFIALTTFQVFRRRPGHMHTLGTGNLNSISITNHHVADLTAPVIRSAISEVNRTRALHWGEFRRQISSPTHAVLQLLSIPRLREISSWLPYRNTENPHPSTCWHKQVTTLSGSPEFTENMVNVSY